MTWVEHKRTDTHRGVKPVRRSWPKPEGFITFDEAADALACSLQAVRALAHKGALARIKYHGRVYFKAADVERERLARLGPLTEGT